MERIQTVLLGQDGNAVSLVRSKSQYSYHKMALLEHQPDVLPTQIRASKEVTILKVWDGVRLNGRGHDEALTEAVKLIHFLQRAGVSSAYFFYHTGFFKRHGSYKPPECMRSST